MTCNHLRRLLVLSTIACAIKGTYSIPDAQDFQTKVSIMLEEEPDNPKCFMDSKKEFTCFWEEDEDGSVDQYTFLYAYRDKNNSECPLTNYTTQEGKRLYICHLDYATMFDQMHIKIHQEGRLIHNRSLLVEDLFLLDPPTNVTLSTTGQHDELNVSWLPPPPKHMDDSFMYEVSYAMAGSHVPQVEVVRASSRTILKDLQPSTKHEVRVRVKLDDVSYDGYWSVWSDPVFLETPPEEFNPLILCLILIMAFILMALSFTLLVSNRRFLRKKIWPTIPTPDGKFKGLFTDYGGDFQEWLKQTNEGLWLTPTLFYNEEYPNSLEVLSELSLNHPQPPPPLPPKMSSAFTLQCTEDVQKSLDLALRKIPHKYWLMDNLRVQNQHPVPCSQSSLLESQDTYVTLTGNNHNQDNILGDSLPVEVLLALKKTTILAEAQ
ncbi:erythropoietin receptor [Corythoichthys intestinalis]|uniref:erythropoietin receptor n=1 Tax=Corythoichthys intestinalis TaxID=161448 RepID=UPI0025A675BA|nr:erythropoietin receptor [Corythoichthys intestinalis]XP_061805047.1 erythropoietin receptor-like [Nerophis lumbriciformis]